LFFIFCRLSAGTHGRLPVVSTRLHDGATLRCDVESKAWNEVWEGVYAKSPFSLAVSVPVEKICPFCGRVVVVLLSASKPSVADEREVGSIDVSRKPNRRNISVGQKNGSVLRYTTEQPEAPAISFQPFCAIVGLRS
jgi:hypothetical protein